jgi:hypothetical protein
MIESLPSVCKALGCIRSTAKHNNTTLHFHYAEIKEEDLLQNLSSRHL